MYDIPSNVYMGSGNFLISTSTVETDSFLLSDDGFLDPSVEHTRSIHTTSNPRPSNTAILPSSLYTLLTDPTYNTQHPLPPYLAIK